MASAFQSTAFQNNAFQIVSLVLTGGIPDKNYSSIPNSQMGNYFGPPEGWKPLEQLLDEKKEREEAEASALEVYKLEVSEPARQRLLAAGLQAKKAREALRIEQKRQAMMRKRNEEAAIIILSLPLL